MATPYHLKIVTPERTVFDGPVTYIIVRSTEGEIGILAHHMQIITPLVPHIITVYPEAGNVEQFTIGGGFLEVGNDTTVVLADSAERASEIDVARAQLARQRALETIAQAKPDIDLIRAKRALQRAENRLKLAGHSTGGMTSA
ncbi:MAG: ATP synthase F1 subunit epsilon [Sulfobacillus thermotolerans]|nr:ATP synthase F1 subunit epsilon [Sulfobacillus thermotolerans]